MSNEGLQSIIDSLKQELEDKTRQLDEANDRAAKLQNQLKSDVEETSSKEIKFAEVWKENQILRRVIAKETEEVHSVYEKCVTVIQKYQELEAQYKEVLSILLNSEPATASQGFISKLQKENEEQKAALDTLTNKFNNKKSKYHTLKGQYKQVKEELENLKSSDPELNDKAKLLEEIAQLKQELATKDQKVNQLTNEVSDLKTKLEIGKYGVEDEAPQFVNDFIKKPAEELEDKYEADKKERNLQIQESSNNKPINITEAISQAKTPCENSLLLRIAELESQLKALQDKTGYELVQNEAGKPWEIVRKSGRERGINLINVQNREEEDEVDPLDLPSVDVSVIQSPKPEERPNLASRSEDEDLNEEENELDSEYEALLAKEDVANKELITKLMEEVRKLRRELKKDKQERRELVESLKQSGSILSAPHSPKGQPQIRNYQPNDVDRDPNEIQEETQPQVFTRKVPQIATLQEEEQQHEIATLQEEQPKVIARDAPILVEEEEEHEVSLQSEPHSNHNSDHNSDHNNAHHDDLEGEEVDIKEAQKLASLINQPPAEDLEEANTRINLLEDEIKKLIEKINNLQFQETQSSMNASNLNASENPITHDFQAALKRISKLQKKLDDHSKPPENMQHFEEEIQRLRTELDESSRHAKELQDLLDSYSQTTNNGVIEVVKENQNMKKTIERKDKEIEDATRKGADILTKYNEQQNTIKTLINELKAAKAKINELSKANSEFSAQVEQLQQDLDQADADAESCKDDLAKLDEITGKYFIAQTELDTTKIKLDKSTALLKTKGGSRAIYALEVYDHIVDYQQEIGAQKELINNIEKILGLEQDSLLNLADKEGQPKPIVDDNNSTLNNSSSQQQQQNQNEEEEKNHNNKEEEQQNEQLNDEERKQRNYLLVKKVLTGSKQPIEPTQLLLFESDNNFFNECDKLNEEYQKLAKETERMRTILSHVEEELHLEPGHLSNRQIDDDLIDSENENIRKLPNGWLNQLVSDNNDGNGLFVQSRAIHLTPEEEEEKLEKEREFERMSAETCNHQSKITELEESCELLRKQITKLNNQISIIETGRLAAIQSNSVLLDKCADLTRRINQLTSLKDNNNKAGHSIMEDFENDYLLAKQKVEESEVKMDKLRRELSKAKSQLQLAEDDKKQINELTQRVHELSKERTELQRKVAELEILNA